MYSTVIELRYKGRCFFDVEGELQKSASGREQPFADRLLSAGAGVGPFTSTSANYEKFGSR